MKQLPKSRITAVYIIGAVLIAVIGGVLLGIAVRNSNADFSFGGSSKSFFADLYFIMVPVLCIGCAFADRALYAEWYKSRTTLWRLLRGLAIMLTVVICYFIGSFAFAQLHS